MSHVVSYMQLCIQISKFNFSVFHSGTFYLIFGFNHNCMQTDLNHEYATMQHIHLSLHEKPKSQNMWPQRKSLAISFFQSLLSKFRLERFSMHANLWMVIEYRAHRKIPSNTRSYNKCPRKRITVRILSTILSNTCTLVS